MRHRLPVTIVGAIRRSRPALVANRLALGAMLSFSAGSWLVAGETEAASGFQVAFESRDLLSQTRQRILSDW
jgi:hypothetical protein